MKTMKKVLAVVLVVALTAVAAVNLTLAYLQDQDEDVNTMTLGNVYIDQIEQERGEGDTLKDFTQAKPLYPAIYEGDAPAKDEKGLYNAPNVVDKMVSVKNTGASAAYVRTIFAFELGSATVEEWKNLIERNTAGPWVWKGIDTAVIENTNYYLVEALYPEALAPNDTTENSLLQVYMKKEATNEDVAKLDGNGNGTYDILVVSQAIQTLGFSDAETALNEGFYVVSKDVHPWTDGVYIPVYYPEAVVENGVITLENGEIRALYGDYNIPLTVQGNGTLELHDVTIKAENGPALTLAEGSDVALVVQGDVTLTGSNGIYVPANVKLDLSGKGGSLTAVGGGGVDSSSGGSGIGGAGEIYIHDLKDLTAEGYGVAGFGIGGDTEKITIENTHITYAKGGYVQPEFINDLKYGKNEPEGGAAIGSMTNGAAITLTNVVIDKAEGGSKSAGIGARYHTGVTVNITGSTIKSVIGGNASAGIGGSRVSSGDATAQAVTINIENSNIIAQGGQFAAGIGSGYDTHCHKPEENPPMCTINIAGTSIINATGGKYAAGIGTGYHNGQLAGEIEESVIVTAASGEKFYKDAYTQAQDVGFGVIDPARDGLNNNCTFNYKGTVISLVAPETSVKVTPENINSMAFDQDATYQFTGTFDTIDVKVPSGKNVVLDGSGATVTGSNIKFTFDAIADGLSTVAESGDFKARTDHYTVQNFTVSNGSISVGGKNTNLVISGNTAKAIDVDGSNCAIEVTGNTVNCDSAYARYDGSTNDKSFYLMAVNYDLKLTGNKLTASAKDCVSINGRGEWDMADYENSKVDGSVTEDKIHNAITITGNEMNAARRAVYIWGDHTYGSNHTLSGTSATVDNLSDAAKTLIKGMLGGGNNVTLGEVYIGFAGLYLTQDQAQAIN